MATSGAGRPGSSRRTVNPVPGGGEREYSCSPRWPTGGSSGRPAGRTGRRPPTQQKTVLADGSQGEARPVRAHPGRGRMPLAIPAACREHGRRKTRGARPQLRQARRGLRAPAAGVGPSGHALGASTSPERAAHARARRASGQPVPRRGTVTFVPWKTRVGRLQGGGPRRAGVERGEDRVRARSGVGCRTRNS